MTGRHVLFLLSAAAVALCALFVIRTFDTEDSIEDAEPVVAAAPPSAPPLRTETEPASEARAPSPPPRSPPTESTPETAPAPQKGIGLEGAHVALRNLANLLRGSRATNEDLLAAIDEVRRFYVHPPPPVGFVPHATPDVATDPARPVINAANLRLLAEHERWPHDYEQGVLAWRRRAEKLLLKALKFQHIDRGQGKNLREDVNVRAAQALASTGNPALSKDIIRTLEKTILKAKYEVSQPSYDESFAALATLGHEDALEWLCEEFIHPKRSPAHYVAELEAAHKAMRRFDRKKVSGRDRFDLVQDMIKTYAGVESMAGQADAEATDKRFWAQVGGGVIDVVQYYAHDPLDAAGEPLATMAEFQAWFRDHKDQRRPPWRVE